MNDCVFNPCTTCLLASQSIHMPSAGEPVCIRSPPCASPGHACHRGEITGYQFRECLSLTTSQSYNNNLNVFLTVQRGFISMTDRIFREEPGNRGHRLLCGLATLGWGGGQGGGGEVRTGQVTTTVAAFFQPLQAPNGELLCTRNAAWLSHGKQFVSRLGVRMAALIVTAEYAGEQFGMEAKTTSE